MYRVAWGRWNEKEKKRVTGCRAFVWSSRIILFGAHSGTHMVAQMSVLLAIRSNQSFSMCVLLEKTGPSIGDESKEPTYNNRADGGIGGEIELPPAVRVVRVT